MPNTKIADGFGPGIEEEVLCNFPDVEGLRESCELAELSKERCRFSVVIPPSMANYRGAVHGGATYLVSEVACGIATYVLGRANVCMQASINFLKAVPCGKVDVVTETRHAGRSSAVVRVEISDAESGAKIAESTHTMFLMGPLEKR